MMTVDKAQSASLFRGLSNSEAQTLLATLGPNTLPQKAGIPLTTRFLLQFRSPLIYILLFALAVDITLWSSEGASTFPVESVAIALILLLNAALGVYQEGKAEAALAMLRAQGYSDALITVSK